MHTEEPNRATIPDEEFAAKIAEMEMRRASFAFNLTRSLDAIRLAMRFLFRISWQRDRVLPEEIAREAMLPEFMVEESMCLPAREHMGCAWREGEQGDRTAPSYLQWRKSEGDDPLQHLLLMAARAGAAAQLKLMIQHHQPYVRLTESDLHGIRNFCDAELSRR